MPKVKPEPKNKRITMDDGNEFLAKSYADRVEAVIQVAKNAVEKLGIYDPHRIAVEPQSTYPDDWYLWTVYTTVKPDVEHHGRYAVWTLNLTDGGLSGGYYDIANEYVLNKILNKKRGTA